MQRNNVIGNWDGKLKEQFIRNNEIISESERDYDIEFNPNGTGSNQNFLLGQPDIPFEWYYQLSPERFIIIYDRIQLFIGLQFLIFEVEKSDSEMQIWTLNVESPIGCFNCNGKYTLTISRK